MSSESPHGESTRVSQIQPLGTADLVCPAERTVILQPIAMTIPNSHGVYSPSRLRPKQEISYKEFLVRYANQARGIRISFDETPSPATILKESQIVTAYSLGLDCWYIVEGYHSAENDLSEK